MNDQKIARIVEQVVARLAADGVSAPALITKRRGPEGRGVHQTVDQDTLNGYRKTGFFAEDVGQ